MSTPELQDAMNNAGTSIGIGENHLQHISNPLHISPGKGVFRSLSGKLNSAEGVVDLVCDAGREGAQGGEPLGMSHHFLFVIPFNGDGGEACGLFNEP
jgi:hypothetical protein